VWIEEPVMAIDILPTIAEETGASLPENIIDAECLKLLKGETDTGPSGSLFLYQGK
jgi:arylsulfatase